MVDYVQLDTRPDLLLDQHHGEQAVALQRPMVQLIHALFRTDPSITACLETLDRHLFGGGIQVTKKNFTVSPWIQHMLDNTWVRFGKDVEWNLHAYGFALMAVREEDETPYVLDPLEFDITIIRNPAKGMRKFRIVPRRALFRDQIVPTPLRHVYVVEERPVDSQGFLTSVAVSLVQQSTFLNRMLFFSMRAEARRSGPPLITEATRQTPDSKAMERDMGHIGDNRAMQLLDRLEGTQEDMYVTAAADQRIRALNRAMESSGGWREPSADRDPITQVQRYPVEEDTTSYFNHRINIEQNRTLVTGPTADSPSFLMNLFEITEADVGKVFGVPPGMWGANRSTVAADLTAQNVLFATINRRRHVITQVLKLMLDVVYGELNLVHAVVNYDEAKSAEANLEDHTMTATLPGIFDAEVLLMLQAQGMMHWEVLMKYVSRYYGIPIEDLAEQKLDAATDRPEADIIEEERVFQLELKASGGAGGGGGGAAGGSSSSSSSGSSGSKSGVTSAAEKSALTRIQNAKSLANRTKRPVSRDTALARRKTTTA